MTEETQKKEFVELTPDESAWLKKFQKAASIGIENLKPGSELHEFMLNQKKGFMAMQLEELLEDDDCDFTEGDIVTMAGIQEVDIEDLTPGTRLYKIMKEQENKSKK